MRRVLDSLGVALGAVLAVVWIVAFLGIEVGGISYRKDCVRADGSVTKSWTFTWFAPIPFLFRPSEQGCEVHTGARVALSALGVARIKDVTLAGEAAKSSRDTALPSDQRYFAALVAALRGNYDYTQAHPDDLPGIVGSIRRTGARLADLTPPESVASEHAVLVAGWRKEASLGKKLIAARSAGDRAEAQRLGEEIAAEDKRQGKLNEAIQTKLGFGPSAG